MAERPILCRNLIYGSPAGFLGYPIDDAARAAAAENHAIGAFQDFHPVYVVEVAKILDVIAQPVNIEIPSRIVAPENHFIAIAFTLRYAHARHIAHHIPHILHGLVSDHLLCYDGDGLRDIAQRVSVRVAPKLFVAI